MQSSKALRHYKLSQVNNMSKSGCDEVHIQHVSKEERLDDEGLIWSRTERHRWLISMTLGTCAMYASRVSVPLVMPAMAGEQNWSKTEAGTVLSSFFWGYTMTQVIGGYLSDRVGGAKVQYLAALGWSIATLATPQIVRCYSHPASKVLILLRVLHGACQGFHYPSLSSLSSKRLSEHERSSFFGVTTAGSAIGAVISGTMGSALLVYFGWPSVFTFIGFSGLAWALFLRNFTMAGDKYNKNLISLPSKLCLVGNGNIMNTLVTSKRPLWMNIFFKPAFWACSIAHACQNNCFYIMMSWLPTYFHEVYPEGKDWVFNVMPWIFLVPATLLGRTLSDHLLSKECSVTQTRKIVETICLISQAASLLLISRMNNFFSAVACATIAISAAGLHHNAAFVNPQDLAPQHAGVVFGFMNTVGSIPGFMGVYFAGHILEATHSWSIVFNMTACINLFGCIFYLVFGSAERIV